MCQSATLRLFLTRTPTGELLQADGMEESTGFNSTKRLTVLRPLHSRFILHLILPKFIWSAMCIHLCFRSEKTKRASYFCFPL